MSTENERPKRRPVRATQDDSATDATAPASPQVAASSPAPVTPDTTPVSTMPELAEETATVEVEPENHPAPVSPEPDPVAPLPAPLPEMQPVARDFEVTPDETPDETPLPPLPAPPAPEAPAEEVNASGRKFGKRSKPADDKPTSELFPKKRRYNPKRKSLIITGSVLGGIAAIIGFSLYKVAQAPAPEDMVAVYQQQSGDYGFPIDKGTEAATRFLSLYLTIPEDPELQQQNKALLEQMLVNATAPTAGSDVSQRIVSGPTPAGLLFQVDSATANQRYTAIVETTIHEPQPGTDITGNPLPDKVKKSLTPLTYRVNMVLDPSGLVPLIDGNPTLLPDTQITSAMKVLPVKDTPDATTSNELTETLVKPFFKVWAASDSAAIKNWLATGASGEWTLGLGGTQTMGNVTVSAPSGVKANGEGYAEAEVEWIAPNGGRQVSSYTLGVVYENSRWLIKSLA